jgi:hypothetical protein
MPHRKHSAEFHRGLEAPAAIAALQERWPGRFRERGTLSARLLPTWRGRSRRRAERRRQHVEKAATAEEPATVEARIIG